MMTALFRNLPKPVEAAIIGAVTVFLWEGLSIPTSSHSNSWHGIWVSICLLAYCSYRLAKCGVSSRWAVLYGCASAILFVPRFLGWDRFQLWLPYVFPTNWHVALLWIGVAFGLGCLSWAAAQLGIVEQAHGVEMSSAFVSVGNTATNRSESAIRIRSTDIIVWLALIISYFSLMWYWSSARQFLENTFSVPDVAATIANGLATSISLGGALSYLRQRTRSQRFFDEPGDRLLVAVAVQTCFDFLARGSQVALSSEETIWLVPDSLHALAMTGRILAGLVFLIPVGSANLRWRCTLRLLAVSSFVSIVIFLFDLPRSFRYWVPISLSVVFLGLVLNSIIRDWRSGQNYRWPHWLGCAAHVASNVGWPLRFLLAVTLA